LSPVLVTPRSKTIFSPKMKEMVFPSLVNLPEKFVTT
jgi:hypothetical protein